MKLYGLLGEKLSHSLSPEIHRQIFDSLNIKCDYVLFEIEKDNLYRVIESIKILGIEGINVTIPYKEQIIKYLDFISDEAKNINAVNTISIKDGKAYGYNTDYFGFGNMLKREGISVEGKIAVILGTGGASKAAAQYLKDDGVKQIFLVSRNKEGIKDKDCIPISYDEVKNIKGDIIINATPVGMYPDVDYSPVDKNVIKNFNTAVDVIYNPLKTKFLINAEKIGIKAINGLYMLVEQAIKAEEIWQGVSIDEKTADEIYYNISSML